jgi:hypothetical protein
MESKGGFARRPEHPYRVASLDHLSGELQQLASQALPAAEAVSAIFVVPEQMLSRDWSGIGGIHRVAAQALIFTPNGVAHAQASIPDEAPGRAVYLRGDQLFYLRLIMVLVYGRIELYGVVDGSLLQVVVEYNSVSQELIQPELYRLLRLSWQPGKPGDNHHLTGALLNSLELKSTKFCSGLRNYALQPDEHLSGYIFQPLIQKKKFGFSKQPLAPASLIALTDRQLILVEEGLTSAMSYGYFFTICPIENVSQIELRPNEAVKANNPIQDVQFQFTRDGVTTERKLTFENPNAQAAQALWAGRLALT